MLAGEDAHVRCTIPISELASWAVDGDRFKIQRLVAGRSLAVVDAYLLGFEEAQRLHVRGPLSSPL